MPEYLYKFVSLDNEWIDGVKSKEKEQMNENKLCSLRKNEIWFSTPEHLNDPYEFRGIYVDYDQLKEDGISRQEVDDLQHLFEDDFVLSSFTLSMEDNFPMWAHYANNHRGFCIKYKVVDPAFITKVRYTTQRHMLTAGIRRAVKISHELKSKGVDLREKRLMVKLQKAYMRVLSQNYSTKHKSWCYEEEYRIIAERSDKDNPYGQYVPAEKVGLCVDAVFTGCKCAHHEKIREIAACLGVPCCQCQADKKDFLIYAE